MNIRELFFEDGRIVKGVNTTADVGPDEIKKQSKKFGNDVDRDGNPVHRMGDNVFLSSKKRDSDGRTS